MVAGEGHTVRLALSGELDLATIPELEDSLRRLHADGSRVELDLSCVEFMDASGLHALVSAMPAPGEAPWLMIAPRLSPQVRRLFSLVSRDPLYGRVVSAAGPAS